MSKLKIGSIVQWQYYNTPERRFYDVVRSGEVVDVVTWKDNNWHSEKFGEVIPDFFPVVGERYETDTRYIVQWFFMSDARLVTLQRKEIKQIVKG